MGAGVSKVSEACADLRLVDLAPVPAGNLCVFPSSLCTSYALSPYAVFKVIELAGKEVVGVIEWGSKCLFFGVALWAPCLFYFCVNRRCSFFFPCYSWPCVACVDGLLCMRSGDDWGRVSNCVADEFNVCLCLWVNLRLSLLSSLWRAATDVRLPCVPERN